MWVVGAETRRTWQGHALADAVYGSSRRPAFPSNQVCIHRLWWSPTEYDRSTEILIRHGAPMGGDSELASHEYCPGGPPSGDPDRSCDYPGQTTHLEGGAGAHGAAEPNQPVEASKRSEQRGVSWHKIRPRRKHYKPAI